MWIKTTKNMIVNTDQLVAIVYRSNTEATICVCTDGSEGTVCEGNALEIISRAIQRDQKYLEVNDCE